MDYTELRTMTFKFEIKVLTAFITKIILSHFRYSVTLNNRFLINTHCKLCIIYVLTSNQTSSFLITFIWLLYIYRGRLRPNSSSL